MKKSILTGQYIVICITILIYLKYVHICIKIGSQYLKKHFIRWVLYWQRCKKWNSGLSPKRKRNLLNSNPFELGRVQSPVLVRKKGNICEFVFYQKPSSSSHNHFISTKFNSQSLLQNIIIVFMKIRRDTTH